MRKPAALLLVWGVLLPLAWSKADELRRVGPLRVLHFSDPLQPKPAVVTGISLSPGGELVAAAGDDHLVRVWSSSTGELAKRLGGHGDWVRCVAFAPDGRQVASAGNDRQTRFWDLETGNIASKLQPQEHAISAITYSPGGDLIALVGFDTNLKLFDAATGALRRELVCRSDDIRAVAFSPNGQWLAAAGRDGGVRVWQVASGEIVADFQAHRRRVRALAWSPNSRLLASAGECRFINIWNFDQPAQNPEQLIKIPAFTSKILSLVFTSDDHLVSGGSNNEVQLWDIHKKSVSFQMEGHTGSVAALAYDPASGLLASGSFDTTIRIWDLKSLQGGKTAAREEARPQR